MVPSVVLHHRTPHCVWLHCLVSLFASLAAPVMAAPAQILLKGNTFDILMFSAAYRLMSRCVCAHTGCVCCSTDKMSSPDSSGGDGGKEDWWRQKVIGSHLEDVMFLGCCLDSHHWTRESILPFFLSLSTEQSDTAHKDLALSKSTNTECLRRIWNRFPDWGIIDPSAS